MATVPLLVEGDTNAAFFDRLITHLSLAHATDLEIRNVQGRSNLQPEVKALITARVSQLIITEDLDDRTEPQIVEPYKQAVSGFLGHPVANISGFLGRPVANLSPSGDSFQAGKVTVTVIPMGLPNDPDLIALGITSHALEDYLIRLLLDDESLRPEVPRFRELIEELVGTIRRYDLGFDSTKELFQLVKPIIKLGFSDTGVVQALFEKANQDHLHAAIDPLIQRLDAAATL